MITSSISKRGARKQKASAAKGGQRVYADEKNRWVRDGESLGEKLLPESLSDDGQAGN